MPLHDDLELLEPEFKKLVGKMLKILDERKIPYYISETKRDPEVQLAYYAQGRRDLSEVNTLRKIAKLYLLSESENKKKVTWTLNSPHCKGLAIDICPALANRPWWSAPEEKWKQIADVAVECGLEAGYYWKDTKDSPHIQMKGA